jgi:hypothetical protein
MSTSNAPFASRPCPGESARELVPVHADLSRAAEAAQRWAAGRGKKNEQTYQVLLTALMAHRTGTCTAGCTAGLAKNVEDQVSALLAGWARSSYRSEHMQSCALAHAWASVMDYDPTRASFLSHLHTSVLRGMGKQADEDSNESSSRVARVAAARRESLRHELGTEPTAAQVLASVQQWFLAEAVIRARGETAEVGADVHTSASLSRVLEAASEHELSDARRRLQRDSIHAWLADEESFGFATGTSLRARLEDPIGADGAVLGDFLADTLAEEESAVPLDRFLGLVAGSGPATNAILERLGDPHRRDSIEEIVARSPEKISAEDVRGAHRGARARCTDPVMQFAWLCDDIESAFLSTQDDSLFSLASALAR